MKCWIAASLDRSDDGFQVALRKSIDECMVKLQDDILDEMVPGLSTHRPTREDGSKDPTWNPTFQIICQDYKE